MGRELYATGGNFHETGNHDYVVVSGRRANFRELRRSGCRTADLVLDTRPTGLKVD